MTAVQTTAAAEPAVSTRERVYYFDYLRVIAIVGVVMIHTADTVVGSKSGGWSALTSQFGVGAAYDTAGRLGVGNFFMISGALLLAPQHTFGLRKQTLRVLLPLVTWSGIYAIANVFFVEADLATVGGSNHNDDSLVEAAKAFFTGPLAYHLWFVYVLIGIYLVLPLLRPLTALPERARTGLVKYALALWFVFTVVVPLVHNIWPDSLQLYRGAVPDLPEGFLGLFVLGFALHTAKWRIPPIVLAAGAAAGAVATYLLVISDRTHGLGAFWASDDLSPNVILFSACSFLLAKALLNRERARFAFFALVSHLSFRIYLVHLLILKSLWSLAPLNDRCQSAPWIGIPILVALTLALSFTFSWLVEQVKPIRAYV